MPRKRRNACLGDWLLLLLLLIWRDLLMLLCQSSLCRLGQYDLRRQDLGGCLVIGQAVRETNLEGACLGEQARLKQWPPKRVAAHERRSEGAMIER